MNILENEIEDLLVEAIMTRNPIIVVEGVDDIPFYQLITKKLTRDFEIIAVENIKNYDEGCENVIKVISDIQEILLEKEGNEKYILGIIDRDTNFFRNKVPNIKSLFMLKYYSFETHLASITNALGLFKMVTNYQSEVGKRLENFIEKDIEEKYELLYYIGLDALKFSLEYTNFTGSRYIDKSGKIFSKNNIEIIEPIVTNHKKDLDKFAYEMGLSKSNIKEIVKGKWYLDIYSDHIYSNIKKLQEACKSNIIEQCQFCKNDKNNKCLYKVRNIISKPIITSIMGDNIDTKEVQYIIDRLEMLA